MTTTVASDTANEQIVAALSITLLCCFIAIGGRSELLRIGCEHTVLIESVLLL